MTRLEDIIKKACAVFSSEIDIAAAYLFGSHAAGLALPGSDIDLAVLLRNIPKTDRQSFLLEKEERMTRRLISTTGHGLIDVTLINNAPVDFQFKVISGGKIVFCRDDAERAAFEEKVILGYLDVKPHIDEYDRLLNKRIKAG